MKIPTEEEFEALLSEFKSHVDESHSNESNDKCEVCCMREELDKRSHARYTRNGRVSVFDEFVGNLISDTPLAAVCMLPHFAASASEISRICFYVGLCMGYAMKETEILNEKFDLGE